MKTTARTNSNGVKEAINFICDSKHSSVYDALRFVRTSFNNSEGWRTALSRDDISSLLEKFPPRHAIFYAKMVNNELLWKFTLGRNKVQNFLYEMGHVKAQIFLKEMNCLPLYKFLIVDSDLALQEAIEWAKETKIPNMLQLVLSNPQFPDDSIIRFANSLGVNLEEVVEMRPSLRSYLMCNAAVSY